MQTVEERAREALNEVTRERGYNAFWRSSARRGMYPAIEAVCRLIEAHDAFKQDVSDAVEKAIFDCGHDGLRKAFSRFITPKPVDPLVEALEAALWDVSNVKLTEHELIAIGNTVRKLVENPDAN